MTEGTKETGPQFLIVPMAWMVAVLILAPDIVSESGRSYHAAWKWIINAGSAVSVYAIFKVSGTKNVAYLALKYLLLLSIMALTVGLWFGH